MVEDTGAMEAEESEDDDLLDDEVDGESLWSDSDFEVKQPTVGVEPTKLSSTYLVFLLLNWANKHEISNVALSALLVILKVHFPDLPKDARTVLKTENKYRIKEISGGFYRHFGFVEYLKIF